LIIADALSVPNRWMRLSDAVYGGEFKYQDYYSIYGFTGVKPISLSPVDTIEAVRDRVGHWERPGLEEIKQRLRDSFPFPRKKLFRWF